MNLINAIVEDLQDTLAQRGYESMTFNDFSNIIFIHIRNGPSIPIDRNKKYSKFEIIYSGTTIAIGPIIMKPYKIARRTYDLADPATTPETIVTKMLESFHLYGEPQTKQQASEWISSTHS